MQTGHLTSVPEAFNGWREEWVLAIVYLAIKKKAKKMEMDFCSSKLEWEERWRKMEWEEILKNLFINKFFRI